MKTEAFSDFIAQYTKQSSRVIESLAAQQAQILELSALFLRVATAGGRIYTCGNGGSACDAMHFAEELVARYLRERPGIRAQHLIDSGTITCWANDYDFHSVFRRQVETLAGKDDVVVGFTTSGNSENICQALGAANSLGALSIAFTGKGGGKIKDIAKHSLIVDSNVTSQIQEAHIVLVHMLCDILERQLFPQIVESKT